MTVVLRPLTRGDAPAHCAGEDDLTVRWLTGGHGTVEGTASYFTWLAQNAADRREKRGFGVWLDGRMAGYVDCDPGISDGLEPGDVNVTYAVHPWARGRGVAVEAVRLICGFVRANQIGTHVQPSESNQRAGRQSGWPRRAGSLTSGTSRPPPTATRTEVRSR